VAIKVSSSKQIDALVAGLGSSSAVAREAAIARLTVIGARAVERLLFAASNDAASLDARAAAWRALEAIADVRALDPALDAIASPATSAAVAAAAAGAAHAFIKGPRGAAVVDRLTAAALDRTRPEGVRVAALRALRSLDRRTLAPLLKSLASDPSAAIRAEAASGAPHTDAGRHAIEHAAEHGLPDQAATLRTAIAKHGGAIPPPSLLRIVERVREREGAEPPARRDEWRLVRAAAHQALADGGSRIALYDLRESLESSKGALPVEFFAPLMQIGDATCLEAIAAAHAKAADTWMREHLSRAFYAIVERERVTKARAAAIWARAGRTGRAGGATRARGTGKAGAGERPKR